MVTERAMASFYWMPGITSTLLMLLIVTMAEAGLPFVPHGYEVQRRPNLGPFVGPIWVH
jgi:hypothetical protein